MKLSLCITNYNRSTYLLDSFSNVYEDDRISEIIIVDDCSDKKVYDVIRGSLKGAGYDNLNKIRLYRNEENIGMSRNKAKAISLASNDWAIILDSDNIINTDYIDAFYSVNYLQPHIIYCPDFAKPKFDYTEYSNCLFGLHNSKNFITEDLFNCMMNTCNYIVNKLEYAKVYNYNPEHIASDTIWFNYNWLKARNQLYIVPGMQYFHRVHDKSGFMKNVDYNMKKANEVRELIKAL